MFRLRPLLFEEAGNDAGAGPIDTGDAPPPAGEAIPEGGTPEATGSPLTQTPTDAPPGEKTADGIPNVSQVWGDRKINFPEGLDETLREEVLFKPFVKDTGDFDYANLLKSYAHTKKAFGRDKLALPTDQSTPDEVNEFHQKLGFEPDIDKYNIKADEKSILKDTFLDEFKAKAHENKIPVKTAQNLFDFMESITSEQVDKESIQNKLDQKEALEGLKKEWGEGYDKKMYLASRVVQEQGSEEFQTYLDKTPAGQDPQMFKFLAELGENIYKEDAFSGEAKARYGWTPQEAKERINEVYADAKHPYNNVGDPRHHDAKKNMQKLFNAAYINED